MTQLERNLKAYFETEVLKHTCFDSLKDLRKDKTLVEVNMPRAMIAVNLLGVWRGMQLGATVARETIHAKV